MNDPINKFLEDMLSFVFPFRCPICGNITDNNERRICSRCSPMLKYIREPRCKKCSKSILLDEQEYCYDCRKTLFHYNKGYALWVYDEVLKKSVRDFKFYGRREYGYFYGMELVNHFELFLNELQPDLLVPVPIHKSKKRSRGFNQAETIALEAGRIKTIPVAADLLLRVKKTRPQKELSDKERLANLEQAFVWNCKYDTLKGKLNKVILIDDIYTTGSTINACSKVLKQAGVHEVYFLVLCIGKGY